MDLDEIESKLHALEKLYGLLLKNYEDTCHSSSDKLDDGARYMLKKLLDMESERVFKAHLEIVKSKGLDNTMNKKFHAGEVPYQAPIGSASLAEKVNQSNMIFTASAFENAKKRCRVCHRLQSKPSSILSYRGGAQTPEALNDLHPSGLISQNEEHNRRSNDDTNFPLTGLSESTKENVSSEGGLGDSSSAVSEFSPSHSTAEARVNMKETNYFSKEDDFVSVEASAVVGKIQSHISALKLDSQSLLPPRKRAALYDLPKNSTGLMASVTDSDRPPMTEQIEDVQKIGKSSHQAEKRQTMQKIVPSLAMRTPSNRFESLCHQIVPFDRFPSLNHGAKKSNWRKIPSAKFMSQMNKEDWENQVSSGSEGIRKAVVDHTSHTVHPTPIPSRRRHLKLESPRLSITEPEPSQPSVSSLHDNLLDQHQIRSLNKKSKIRRRMRKEPMDPGDIESTDSDNSAPENQLTGDSSNEIDLNSDSPETHTSKTSSIRSDSDEVYSLPSRNRHLPSNSISSGETEVYSSASRSDTEIYSSTSGSRPPTPTSSNERSKYTSKARPGKRHNQEQSYSSDDSATSRKSGSVHTKTSRNMKRRGGLKKLKDKLAIIFHHHHHHHHHHSDKTDPNSPTSSKINHGKSLWKRSKKVTDLERQKEIKGEHAVEKLGNSIVRGGARKKHGHFYELMKGALRHRRRSKQSKSSKVSAKQSRIHHGSKKVPKKSHWLKLLHNHKGKKLHKRAHSKI